MAEKKSFLLRIDAQTLDQLKRWADDDFRSLNGQIEYLLKSALRQAKRDSHSSAEKANPPAQ